MNPGDLQSGLRRVEELLHLFDRCADSERAAARELVRALLNLHTAGIAKLLELSGPDAVARGVDDPLVSGLLLLHGLHPLSAEARVRRALEQARPRFHAHGGDVELLSATDEVVRLRLHGEASERLHALAEACVVEAAPDAVLAFEEAGAPANGRVSLPLVSVAASRRGGTP